MATASSRRRHVDACSSPVGDRPAWRWRGSLPSAATRSRSTSRRTSSVGSGGWPVASRAAGRSSTTWRGTGRSSPGSACASCSAPSWTSRRSLPPTPTTWSWRPVPSLPGGRSSATCVSPIGSRGSTTTASPRSRRSSPAPSRPRARCSSSTTSATGGGSARRCCCRSPAATSRSSRRRQSSPPGCSTAPPTSPPGDDSASPVAGWSRTPRSRAGRVLAPSCARR